MPALPALPAPSCRFPPGTRKIGPCLPRCGSSPTRRSRAPRARRSSKAITSSCCATRGRTIPAWLEAINSAERWVHFESYILRDDHQRPRVRRGAGRGHEARRPRPPALRLARRGDGDAVDVLGAPAPRRHRRPRVQSAAARLAARLVVARPSQDDWRRRPRRVRHRPVRRRHVVGPRAQQGSRSVARHRRRRVAGRPWPTSRTRLPKCGPPPVRRCPTTSATAGPIAPAGKTSLRVIGTKPSVGGVFRLDQLVAAVARERLVDYRRVLRRRVAVRAGADRRLARRR